MSVALQCYLEAEISRRNQHHHQHQLGYHDKLNTTESASHDDLRIDLDQLSAIYISHQSDLSLRVGTHCNPACLSRLFIYALYTAYELYVCIICICMLVYVCILAYIDKCVYVIFFSLYNVCMYVLYMEKNVASHEYRVSQSIEGRKFYNIHSCSDCHLVAADFNISATVDPVALLPTNRSSPFHWANKVPPSAKVRVTLE